MDELETRLVPWERVEVVYAWNRPPAEQTPIPHVGDRVWYRRDEWDPHDRVLPADVVEVADLDDRSDPHLWHVARDEHGRPVVDGPRGSEVPRMVRAPDPWPWLRLRVPDRAGLVQTQEARLRGSAGWLPLDYRQRPVRLPAEVHARVAALGIEPVNLPFGTMGMGGLRWGPYPSR